MVLPKLSSFLCQWWNCHIFDILKNSHYRNISSHRPWMWLYMMTGCYLLHHSHRSGRRKSANEPLDAWEDLSMSAITAMFDNPATMSPEYNPLHTFLTVNFEFSGRRTICRFYFRYKVILQLYKGCYLNQHTALFSCLEKEAHRNLCINFQDWSRKNIHRFYKK